MDKISCIAIDDEPIALSIIAQFCERKGGMELKVFSDPQLGLEEILRSRPDLVFLDIEMNGMNGLGIARSLPRECCFIFTTAYIKYAFDGFELDTVDFLHKPFAYDRFSKAVDKAILHIRHLRNRRKEQKIIVKQEYMNVSIPLVDIVYMEAMENYSKIFCSNKPCTLSRISLKKLQELLPPDDFIRIHRSYIVAVDKVTGFNKSEVHVLGGNTLPVGRRYVKDVILRIGNILK